MADTATAETSKLEDIVIIICIRANFLGLTASAVLDRPDRSDTLEHCIICVSFILYMIPDLKFIFTHRMLTVCEFEIHIFLCSVDDRGSRDYTGTIQLCESRISTPITSAKA